MELSWTSVVAHRMRRQGLVSGLASVADAASAMGGAHAQVMSAAELSLGIRVPGTTLAEIRDSLRAGGTLVKTYGVRGTVHLLPRSDLAMWCGALPAVPMGTSHAAGIDLESQQLDDLVDAIRDALHGSEPVDGDQLGSAVVDRVGSWADERVVPAFGGWWPRWRLAIQVAAHRGVLAFGDNRGSRVTYLSPDVLPEQDQSRALDWLLTQFLGTYGPAAPEHYARWLGVRKGWASEQFARAELENVSDEGQAAFRLPGDPLDGEPLQNSVALLPHFDPYVIGSFPRERVFPGEAATRALARGQAGVHPVLLVDGVVAGIWTGLKRAGSFEITVEPVVTLSRSERSGLESAAARIADFVGLEGAVSIGPVATGPHK